MSTALAIRPKPHALEFRRCTGHCCDPVTLGEDPGYFLRKTALGILGDTKWIAEHLVYLGWRPPSQGGWPEHGTHEYRCPHFDKIARRCLIYGQGKRSLMCRTHPNYGRDPWKVCTHDGCTRRTIVLSVDGCSTRWRFPDLWRRDLVRWEAWEKDACQPETGPECQDERYER